MISKLLVPRHILIFLALASLLPGCSGQPDRPAVAPVHGKVIYRGKPVTGATVAFLCMGASRSAVGMTDESGNYLLTTYEPDDGAIIGSHVVTVKKYAEISETAPSASGEALSEKAMSKAIDAAMSQTAQQLAEAERKGSSIPVKYGQRTTSDLVKEVTAGENVIDLKLVD